MNLEDLGLPLGKTVAAETIFVYAITQGLAMPYVTMMRSLLFTLMMQIFRHRAHLTGGGLKP